MLVEPVDLRSWWESGEPQLQGLLPASESERYAVDVWPRTWVVYLGLRPEDRSRPIRALGVVVCSYDGNTGSWTVRHGS